MRTPQPWRCPPPTKGGCVVVLFATLAGFASAAYAVWQAIA